MTRYFSSSMRIENQAEKLPISVPSNIINNLTFLSRNKIDSKQEIESLQRKTREYQQRIQEAARYLEETKQELETKLQNVNTPIEEKKYLEFIKTMAEDPWIFKLTINDTNIHFVTNATHVMLRQEADLAINQLTMIGCFDVKIYLRNGDRWSKYNVIIKNLTFPENYNPHWGVHSSGRMCQGEFENSIHLSIDTENYIELINTIKTFLHSWKDASTYCKHHNWQTRNKEKHGETKIEELNKLPRYENFSVVAKLNNKPIRYSSNSTNTKKLIKYIKKNFENNEETTQTTSQTKTTITNTI